jgi:hypothetical protein
MTPDHLFSTALYLFSSLLQADAAILGFGAIFVIYKLQALDNQLALTMDGFDALTPGHPGGRAIAEGVLRSGKEDLARNIRNRLKDPMKKSSVAYIEAIRAIPKRKDKVKDMIKLPIGVIGSHACISTISLLLTCYITN